MPKKSVEEMADENNHISDLTGGVQNSFSSCLFMILLISLHKSDKLTRKMEMSFLVEFEKVFGSGDRPKVQQLVFLLVEEPHKW